MDKMQEIRALKKALKALVFINVHGQSTVTDVAKGTGVPRSTSYRILETLQSEGYLRRDQTANSYRVTGKVGLLSGGYNRDRWVTEAAEDVIHDLGAEVLWPVTLSTPRLDQVVIQLSTDHDTTLTLDRFTPGWEVPITHSASGLCYLAHCKSDEREAILALANQSPDPHQALARNPDQLQWVLERAREDGYVNLEFAEYREGNIAVPAFTEDGVVVGGIVMRYLKVAPCRRTLVGTYVPKLQAAAQRLRRALGAYADFCSARSGLLTT